MCTYLPNIYFVWIVFFEIIFLKNYMSSPFSAKSLFNLNYNNLVPMMRLTSEAEISEDTGNYVPLLPGKILQWPVTWISANPISKIYIKLGTCARINHCQLVLSVLQEQIVRATAVLDGTQVQDNQWAELILDQPVSPGHYFCQLQSPDANDLNTLFIQLRMAKPQVDQEPLYNLLNLSYDGLMPVMKLPSEPESDMNMTKSIPLLRGKTVQWSVNWQHQTLINKILLKFGTCSRINNCQLELSIWQMSNNYPQTMIARATLPGTQVQDNDWTEFSLDRPVVAGQYQCQLQSPDADDLNTVFVWLTVAP
jgi:hypothetical protein